MTMYNLKFIINLYIYSTVLYGSAGGDNGHNILLAAGRRLVSARWRPSVPRGYSEETGESRLARCVQGEVTGELDVRV